MRIRFSAIAGIVASSILAFGSHPALAQRQTGDLVEKVIAESEVKSTSPEGCRDDVLDGHDLGEESCVVKEQSINCQGKRLGECLCQQITYFDENVKRPPFPDRITPSACYQIAVSLRCLFLSSEVVLNAMVPGNFCVSPTGNAFRSFGPGRLRDSEPIKVFTGMKASWSDTAIGLPAGDYVITLEAADFN